MCRPGPIVTSVLLADEINRLPAKVQSALLEAMQEGQITVGDETLVLPDTFWVLATQNPIEHEGTYPLPEAQLDRFLMKLVVGYPDRAAELRMLDLPSVSETLRPDSDTRTSAEPPLFGPADVVAFRALAASIRIAPAVKEYIVDLVRATREPASFGLPLAPLRALGASPRATIAAFAGARAAMCCSAAETSSPPTTSKPWPVTSCAIESWSASEADAEVARTRRDPLAASSTTSLFPEPARHQCPPLWRRVGAGLSPNAVDGRTPPRCLAAHSPPDEGAARGG